MKPKRLFEMGINLLHAIRFAVSGRPGAAGRWTEWIPSCTRLCSCPRCATCCRVREFRRRRTLMLTIVCYLVFPFLSAFATGVWQLATLRLLAGVGIGGEWAMGGTFVAEE